MIIVTGATGKLGRAIVQGLLAKVPAEQIGVSVRDTEKAGDFQERGVRVRRGDFADPATLRTAFEGASQVLIISSNSFGEEAVQHHRHAIEAAKAVGVARILYTSHMGSNPNSLFASMRDHAATEALLESSGVPFTSLRNGFYADSALMMAGPFLQTGQIVAPEDGPVSWTTHSDLADAAVIALTQEGQLDGLTPPLTSSQAVDLSAIADIASELTGRPITRVTVSDEEHRAGLISHGVPEMYADLLMGIFAASRRGEFAAIDPTLEQLLGRSPQSMSDVLVNHISG